MFSSVSSSLLVVDLTAFCFAWPLPCVRVRLPLVWLVCGKSAGVPTQEPRGQCRHSGPQTSPLRSALLLKPCHSLFLPYTLTLHQVPLCGVLSGTVIAREGPHFLLEHPQGKGWVSASLSGMQDKKVLDMPSSPDHKGREHPHGVTFNDVPTATKKETRYSDAGLVSARVWS